MTLTALYQQLITHLNPDALQRLSAAGQAQLLQMSCTRLRYSISAMPFMGALLSAQLVFVANKSPVWLLVWGTCYLSAAWLIRLWHARFTSELAAGVTVTLVSHWQRKLERLATAHGVGISLLIPLNMHQESEELMLLLNVLLVSVLSANSGQMTPFFSIFHRMFWGSLGVVLLVPWSLPSHWHYLLPMSILLAAMMYRSAIHSHLFFVRQVELEELSRDLAVR